MDTRRAFLNKTLAGALGMTALDQLMAKGVVSPLHHPAKAKRVIFLYQAGGPSHLETFDYKPMLAKLHGQGMPESFTKGQQIAQLQGKPLNCFGPQLGFKKFGKSGMEICELFPEIGSVADDICIVRSMWSEQINHDTAHMFLNTGFIIAGRPSMGSWVTYGLGSENQNMPGFVVMCPGGYPIQESQNWQSAFLPGVYQGTYINTEHTRIERLIENITNNYQSLPEQRAQLDLLQQLNQRHRQARAADAQIDARIQSFELAYRMQTTAPEAFDIMKEPEAIRDLYGLERPECKHFAAQCLKDETMAESIADAHRTGQVGGEVAPLVVHVTGAVRQPGLVRLPAGFSPELAAVGRKFFGTGWIDAPARPGKSPGAFAHPTVPSAHPYLLLNYQGKVRDVMTLAHELGHGVHQVLAGGQGALMADTPLTLAETASVFGEMLTFQSLLRSAPDKKTRKAMLAGKVEDMLNTVVRQIAFYDFESRLHMKRREGELTPDAIGEIWMAVQTESLGPAFTFDDEYRHYWSYIGHFIHSPFYVYAYAFGDCLVNSLYAAYQAKPDGFQTKYLDMLRAGGVKRHKELLAPFGLDASDPAFWDRGLGVISGFVDELEKL